MGIHHYEYRVLFGDTDGMGIVYNANYLRIFEAARTEYFRKLLRLPKEMVASDNYPVVVKAFLEYHSPAAFDDILVIDCWIPEDKVKKVSFRFDYAVREKASDRRVCSGYTVHALTSREGKLKRMPADFLRDVVKLSVGYTEVR